MNDTTKKELSLAERRSRLERRANVIRSRLLRTVDALDVRRHQVVEVTHHVKRLATPMALTVLGAAAVITAAGLGIRAFVRSRRERHLSYRIQRALEPYRHPKRPSLLEEALRKVTLTFVSIAATELAKRGAKNVLDGRLPTGEPELPVNGHARLVGRG